MSTTNSECSPKRPHPDDDNEDVPIVVFKKMKMDDNKRSFEKYNVVADIMFGNHVGGTDEVLTVEQPPSTKCPNLKSFLKQMLGGKYKMSELGSVGDGVHKIIDVYNHIKEYNTAYYLTQKKEVTFSMTVLQVTHFLEIKMTEGEFIRELFGVEPSRFNVVYPMYHNNHITDIVFGVHAVMSVLVYFKTHDKKHIDFNGTSKCSALLKWCVDEGLAKDVHASEHPPIPTAPRFHKYNCSVGAITSIFQVPETNFATIQRITDNWGEYDMEVGVNDTNDKIYLLDELPDNGRTYTLITSDYSLSGHMVGSKSVMYFNDVPVKKVAKNIRHSYIFVFKNSTTSKQCGYLDHCLIKGITRLQSYTKYLREYVVKNNKAVFKKYVIKY
jgi:hypothetical protein